MRFQFGSSQFILGVNNVSSILSRYLATSKRAKAHFNQFNRYLCVQFAKCFRRNSIRTIWIIYSVDNYTTSTQVFRSFWIVQPKQCTRLHMQYYCDLVEYAFRAIYRWLGIQTNFEYLLYSESRVVPFSIDFQYFAKHQEMFTVVDWIRCNYNQSGIIFSIINYDFARLRLAKEQTG